MCVCGVRARGPELWVSLGVSLSLCLSMSLCVCLSLSRFVQHVSDLAVLGTFAHAVSCAWNMLPGSARPS